MNFLLVLRSLAAPVCNENCGTSAYLYNAFNSREKLGKRIKAVSGAII